MKTLHESIVERLAALDALVQEEWITEKEYNSQCYHLNVALQKLAEKNENVVSSSEEGTGKTDSLPV